MQLNTAKVSNFLRFTQTNCMCCISWGCPHFFLHKKYFTLQNLLCSRVLCLLTCLLRWFCCTPPSKQFTHFCHTTAESIYAYLFLCSP